MYKSSLVIVAALSVAGCLTGTSTTDMPSDQKAKSWESLIGSWQVTSAQTSLILSLEPDQKALVLWIRPGGHSMLRTSWEPQPGGILVHGIPRIRLWTGRDKRNNELRAELEAIPEIGYDPNKDFHDHFFMGRIKDEEMPLQWQTRPIPERWKKETVGADWNATAGRKPLPENEEDNTEQTDSLDKK